MADTPHLLHLCSHLLSISCLSSGGHKSTWMLGCLRTMPGLLQLISMRVKLESKPAEACGTFLHTNNRNGSCLCLALEETNFFSISLRVLFSHKSADGKRRFVSARCLRSVSTCSTESFYQKLQNSFNRMFDDCFRICGDRVTEDQKIQQLSTCSLQEQLWC